MRRGRQDEEDDVEDEVNVDQPAALRRGRSRKRFEKDNCPTNSAYQFFKIEVEHDRGYDYRCILHHQNPQAAIVKSCVGPANLLSHLRKVHGFVPISEGPATKEDKISFFARSAPRVSFDNATSLLLSMIVRDLRPFSIMDGPGFARMLDGFGNSSLFYIYVQVVTSTSFSILSLGVSEVPSPSHIASCLDKLFVQRVFKLKAVLAAHSFPFAVSIDGWKLGSKGVPMYCMVAHLLTAEFDLLCVPLDISSTLDKTAAGIKAWIRAAFVKLGLSLDNLLCVTSDEAAAEQCAIDLIGCYRVRCVPHRLSNVVKTAFVKTSLEAADTKKLKDGEAECLVRVTKKMVKFVNNRKDIRAYHDAQRAEHGNVDL